jgi:hypothetical protein
LREDWQVATKARPDESFPESRQITLGVAQVHAHTVGMDMLKLTVYFACHHCGALFTAT